MKITVTIELDEREKTYKNHGELSCYARVFDERSPKWINVKEADKLFLKVQERYANDLLKARGYLFLNDVYDILGFPRTAIGQVVGWIYDEKDANGDNFVSFGKYRDEFILDFNVDGEILSKVEL